MNRRWLGVALTMAAAAAGADLLASDLPLAVRIDGQTHLLPCVFRPASLRATSTRALRGKAEWLIGTPIAYGPDETAAVTLETHDEQPPWAPDARHPLGTDELGRDVLARVIHGARVSLLVALGTALLSVLVGSFLGCLAGLGGGLTDAVISRLIELMSTFPTLFFLIAVFSVVRTPSLMVLVLVLGLTRWADVARLVRVETQRLRHSDFTRWAWLNGAGPWWLWRRHLLPNALAPLLVIATFSVASTLLLESALSSLGLGVRPPTASWGALLLEAQRNLLHPGAWWLAVFPGLALVSTVLVVNAAGESLRRSVDGPK